MDIYKISTDPAEIISGTSNISSRLYKEASDAIESNTPKSMGYLKNFITSIESIAGKENVQDDRISSTRGNMSKFSGYENVKFAIDFLSKNLPGMPIVQNLITIHKALEINQALYMSGYDKQVRLIILEYESALYMLITGLSFAMVNNIDVVSTGTSINIKRKSSPDKGVISKVVKEMARELSSKDHQAYLQTLISAKDELPIGESVLMETNRSLSDTLDIISSLASGVGKLASFGKRTFQTLKRTMFGIIPLIQSVLYLKYKKKADHILALDQQVNFLNMNINQLKNIKTMDEEEKQVIIKKQEAKIEEWKKKAAKLRAQLDETEKDTSAAVNATTPAIQADSSDDFTLA